MLAHSYEGHMQYPCDGQPKLDGFRMLYNSALGAWTRTGHAIETVDHLAFDTKGLTLDGELKLPDGTFQRTASAIKATNRDTPRLVYYVFDVVDPKRTWTERKALLEKASETFPNGVQMVPSVELKDAKDVELSLAFLVKHGHEGLILRSRDAHYIPGARSFGLQKHKPFEDAEFTVADVVEGKGKDRGCAILVLHNPEGKTLKAKTFRARPVGSYAERAKMLANKAAVIGRQATVRFQGRSEDRIPRFPRAVGLREEWDK